MIERSQWPVSTALRSDAGRHFVRSDESALSWNQEFLSSWASV